MVHRLPNEGGGDELRSKKPVLGDGGRQLAEGWVQSLSEKRPVFF